MDKTVFLEYSADFGNSFLLTKTEQVFIHLEVSHIHLLIAYRT